MKTPRPTKNAERGARDKRQFSGTTNPRHLRAIDALLKGGVSRHDLARIAGAANAPELVAELRRRGLEVPCQRVDFTDRDGDKCKPGIYSFTEHDCQLIAEWMASGIQGGAK